MAEHLDKARNAWGDDMPEWVHALAVACDGTSQNKAAREIGYSAAVVSMVLKAAYTGDLKAVERRVSAALLNAMVDCPVAGEISLSACTHYQKPAPRLVNSRQIQFLRTCPTCPNFGGK